MTYYGGGDPYEVAEQLPGHVLVETGMATATDREVIGEALARVKKAWGDDSDIAHELNDALGDCCDGCGAIYSSFDGYDGKCGDCADRAENEGDEE